MHNQDGIKLTPLNPEVWLEEMKTMRYILDFIECTKEFATNVLQIQTKEQLQFMNFNRDTRLEWIEDNPLYVARLHMVEPKGNRKTIIVTHNNTLFVLNPYDNISFNGNRYLNYTPRTYAEAEATVK